MRGLFRTLSGIEWPPNQVTTAPSTAYWQPQPEHEPPSHQDPSDYDPSLELRSFQKPQPNMSGGLPKIRIKKTMLFVTVLIRLLVLSFELVVIYSSSNVTRVVTAGSNFDARLSQSGLAGMGSDNSPCRGYIQNTRGMEHSGRVLLCIESTEERVLHERQSDTTLSFEFDAEENNFRYLVKDSFAMTTVITVKVKLALMTGEDIGLAPLRPDIGIDNNYGDRLVRFVFTESLKKVGFNATRHDIEREVQDEVVVKYKYPKQMFTKSRLEISEAVLGELRKLTLNLNSTRGKEVDGVWLFRKDHGYVLNNEMAIAIVSSNRVAHGWLLVVWLALLITRLLTQRWFMVFDEVAFAAVKTIHGENLAAGPFAKTADRAPLRVSKFSDGTVGHIGFRPANDDQTVVENFEGCQVVLGARSKS